jgi:hypothetical protein
MGLGMKSSMPGPFYRRARRARRCDAEEDLRLATCLARPSAGDSLRHPSALSAPSCRTQADFELVTPPARAAGGRLQWAPPSTGTSLNLDSTAKIATTTGWVRIGPLSPAGSVAGSTPGNSFPTTCSASPKCSLTEPATRSRATESPSSARRRMAGARAGDLAVGLGVLRKKTRDAGRRRRRRAGCGRARRRRGARAASQPWSSSSPRRDGAAAEFVAAARITETPAGAAGVVDRAVGRAGGDEGPVPPCMHEAGAAVRGEFEGGMRVVARW